MGLRFSFLFRPECLSRPSLVLLSHAGAGRMWQRTGAGRLRASGGCAAGRVSAQTAYHPLGLLAQGVYIITVFPEEFPHASRLHMREPREQAVLRVQYLQQYPVGLFLASLVGMRRRHTLREEFPAQVPGQPFLCSAFHCQSLLVLSRRGARAFHKGTLYSAIGKGSPVSNLLFAPDLAPRSLCLGPGLSPSAQPRAPLCGWPMRGWLSPRPSPAQR